MEELMGIVMDENFDTSEEVEILPSEGKGCTCHLNDLSAPPLPCSVCSKSNQATTHFCDICSKSFGSSEGLKLHCLNFHSGCLCNALDSRGNPRVCRLCTSKKNTFEKNYKCDVCPKTYATKKSMRKHYFKIHEGRQYGFPKMFNCPFCSKSFDNEALLEKHLTTHPGDKPHTCNECGKGFVTKLTLQNHFRIHEREQDDYKPHTCEMCKKVFPSKSQRNLHYRSHERPFPCDECLESFTHKSLLANHKKKFHVIAENKEKAMSWR